MSAVNTKFTPHACAPISDQISNQDLHWWAARILQVPRLTTVENMSLSCCRSNESTHNVSQETRENLREVLAQSQGTYEQEQHTNIQRKEPRSYCTTVL